MRTLAGESIQGVTLSDSPFRDWLMRVLEVITELGGIGPITIQAFLTDPEPTLSEVNARFGGGFPLANAAGGRYPEWIVAMCRGESLAPRLGAYQVGLYMTRANTETFVEEPLWK
jgi:carbamoyl-phosphate synthase large subunit